MIGFSVFGWIRQQNRDRARKVLEQNSLDINQEVLQLQIQLASVDEDDQITAFVLLRTIKWDDDNAYKVNQILHDFLLRQNKAKRARFNRIAAEADRLSGRNRIRKLSWPKIYIAVVGMSVVLSIIIFLS